MDRRDELLKKSWEGEILGRTFFAALDGPYPEDRRLWEMLTALETTMEALVAPVAQAHGLAVDAAALEASGRELAEGSAGGRDELFKGTLTVVAEFLDIYRELTNLLPEDEAWLGDELVAHEQALASYIEHELEGRPGGEVRVVQFLERHGADLPAGA